MATVMEVIKRVFPEGTNPGDREHHFFPVWPPDMFAITAKLVELSGCYTHPTFRGFGSTSRFHQRATMERVTRLADGWVSPEFSALVNEADPNDNDGTAVPNAVVEELQALWKTLLAAGSEKVERVLGPSQATLQWWDTALTLLTVADEASAGMGFPPRPANSPRRLNTRFAELVLEEYRKAVPLKRRRQSANKPSTRPPKSPHLLTPTITLCRMVPHEELCVQPKATTPQTGCSLRSLTHHLALLPSTGEVTSYWHMVPGNMVLEDAPDDKGALEHPLNLLLVPFPYEVDGNAFVPVGSTVGSSRDQSGTNRAQEEGKPSFFGVNQDWLTDIEATDFADFVRKLIDRAHRDVDIVHGVVLPEFALTKSFAMEVASILADKTKLELFITGTSSTDENSGEPINAAHTFVFYEKKIHHQWEQSKHHRWKLNKQQIRRYHLGNSLWTEADWWENININNRCCYFCLFRSGATLTALVCEDLARIDPVQPVIRAVGPNLVIALLMDGPQLPDRWPNRYATVLAEDPGSAVLTLTSLGMVRRSYDPGTKQDHIIGLWKDPIAKQLVDLRLEDEAHALLLTVTFSKQCEYTLDTRSDESGAWKLNLMGIRAIRHPRLWRLKGT